MNDRWIGLDIGGTKCAVVLAQVGRGIRILDKERFPTRTDLGFPQAFEKLCAAADSILARTGTDPGALRGIGVSCGGPLDAERGVILNPPNLPGWENVPLTAMLKERYSVPVSLQNDANACALVEWRLGAGRGCRDMIFLTMGTGMGAGIIAGGRLLSGCCDMAGEVGHIRLAPDGPEGYGKSGSFEGFASGGGMDRRARAWTKAQAEGGNPPQWLLDGHEIEETDVPLIAAYARRGDADALRLFDEAGQRLGEGIAILADVLNPRRVVIGSVFVRCEDLLRIPMEKALEREALPRVRENLEVLPAQTEEHLGDYAAVMAALNAEEIDPMA